MNLKSGKALLLFTAMMVVCLVALMASSPARPQLTGSIDAVKKSVARSLPFLLRDGQAWMDGEISIQHGNACVSCHQPAFAIWSHNAARQHGIQVDEAGLARLSRQALNFFIEQPGERRADNVGHMFLGRLADSDYGSEAGWQELLQDVVTRQLQDGHWQARGQFPRQNRPAAEANQATTMWTILAMSRSKMLTAPQQVSQQKAMSWVAKFDSGQSREWLALKMLVEYKLGKKTTALNLRDQLISAQNDDGGWSWLAGNASDAFMTGQSLYALSLVGEARTQPAMLAAIKFLLGTQQSDGTWKLASHLISKKGTESKDYVYRYWGTAWAAIGLSHTLPCEDETLWSVVN